MKYRINIKNFSDAEIFAAYEFAKGYPYVTLTNNSIVIEGKRKTLIGLAGWLHGYCLKLSNLPFEGSIGESFDVKSLLDEITSYLKQIALKT